MGLLALFGTGAGQHQHGFPLARDDDQQRADHQKIRATRRAVRGSIPHHERLC